MLRKKKWLLSAVVALPLAIAGVAYAQSITPAGQPQNTGGYICPLTGEELPCPRCCPLNGDEK